MKAITFLLAAFLFIHGFFLAPAKAEMILPEGELHMPQKSFNFGVVPEGQPVEHVFILENAGTKKLEITSVRPDCCSSVSLSKGSLAPGERGYLKVTLETYDKQGLFIQTVRVHTDSPKTPYDYVRLFGIVGKIPTP